MFKIPASVGSHGCLLGMYMTIISVQRIYRVRLKTIKPFKGKDQRNRIEIINGKKMPLSGEI